MRAMWRFVTWSLGLAAAETQTTTVERDCLARHVQGRRRVVEIGVWHGVTTKRLRSAMAPDGVLTAVDPFPVGRLGFSPQLRIAREEVASVANGTVVWVRSTGAAAARDHSSVDFVFVDGDHSEQGLLDDWHAWSPLVEVDGVVALHDSRSTAARPIDDAGSVRVTRDVILPDPRFTVIEEADSLTVLRRVS